MVWFHFRQNNSGGSFDVDKNLCHHLFIEADNKATAIEKAVGFGVYFDGIESGMDCPCCGDRWYEPSEEKFPIKWTTEKEFLTVEEYAQMLADDFGWTIPDARIFRADGSVTEIKGKITE